MTLDVMVVGAGFVASTLVRALSSAHTDLRIGILDVTAGGAVRPTSDDRPIALAEGSMRILRSLGFDDVLARCAAPIACVHVSERGQFGFCRLHADELDVSALGHVVDAHALANVLSGAEADTDHCQRFQVEVLLRISAGEHGVSVEFRDAVGSQVKTLTTRLLIATDGRSGGVQDLLSVPVRRRDYQQVAITATARMSLAHDGVAYERFTNTGPIAMLPMTDERSGLIWTLPSEQADQYLDLDDASFARVMRTRFGRRLGQVLQLSERHGHPLWLHEYGAPALPRVLLLGSAARTLHPVAGQALNLALRDISALAEILIDHRRRDEDVGQARVLEEFTRWRRHDQQRVTWATDSLVSLFAVDWTALRLARGAGLLCLDHLPPLKKAFARHAAGLAGRQSRLMRGLGL